MERLGHEKNHNQCLYASNNALTQQFAFLKLSNSAQHFCLKINSTFSKTQTSCFSVVVHAIISLRIRQNCTYTIVYSVCEAQRKLNVIFFVKPWKNFFEC